MKYIVTVVGARPQFVKAAMLSRALAASGIEEKLVHTGQHYDDAMSRVFFTELELPEPAVNLGVGSGPHGRQTGEMMVRLENVLLADRRQPDAIVVYGDTNSTLAAAITAAKLGIPVAHVEAGLRSFNRAMPEELNRIVTDRLSALLFCPSQTAVDHLVDEGIHTGVHLTGDVMYDAVLHYRTRALERYPLSRLVPFEFGGYDLVTAHRAGTVDDPARLRQLLTLLELVDRPMVWPVHPRTRDRLTRLDMPLPEGILALEPVGYLEMLTLLQGSRRVLTDSGGLQKEAYWLERPCLTLRNETEWVETLAEGWNTLVGLDEAAFRAALETTPTGPVRPHYGRGDAAEQMTDLLQH